MKVNIYREAAIAAQHVFGLNRLTIPAYAEAAGISLRDALREHGKIRRRQTIAARSSVEEVVVVYGSVAARHARDR